MRFPTEFGKVWKFIFWVDTWFKLLRYKKSELAFMARNMNGISQTEQTYLLLLELVELGKMMLTIVFFNKKMLKALCYSDFQHFICSGGRTRTCDLRVMSPTSYHCSTPQCLRLQKYTFFAF